MSGVVTTGPANLTVPGAYVAVLPPEQAISPFVNTSLNAFVGGANWGPVNQPVSLSDASSIFAAFGNDTTSTYALVLELLNALTEDGNSVAVRVTDLSDTAATIVVKDASAGTSFTLTAKYTGSLPNGNAALNISPASCRVDLVSGTLSVAPVFRVTIFFPNAEPEVFNNIIGSLSINGVFGAFSGVAFANNLKAAINGTAQNTVGSQRWTCSVPGTPDTNPPVTGTLTAATGGADGTASLNTAALIGADAAPRTGMYALRGTGFFHLGLCGMTDLTAAATMSAFVESEGAALGFITVPKGTSDSAAFGLQNTNAVFYSNMVLLKDYIYILDQVQGTLRYVSPIGKAMGIIGLLPPYESSINQPWNTSGGSAAYVLGTEQSVVGPRSTAELAALITNGWLAITNQMAIGNGAFGFFDDVCSSGDPNSNNGAGSYIPVQRMNAFLAQALVQLGGPFVGKNQSAQPNDPLRKAVEASFNNFFSSLAPNGGIQQIDNWDVTCDLTNNTPQSIAAGFCYVKVLAKFLGVVRIFYVTLQGGTNVQISTAPPQGSQP